MRSSDLDTIESYLGATRTPPVSRRAGIVDLGWISNLGTWCQQHGHQLALVHSLQKRNETLRAAGTSYMVLDTRYAELLAFLIVVSVRGGFSQAVLEALTRKLLLDQSLAQNVASRHYSLAYDYLAWMNNAMVDLGRAAYKGYRYLPGGARHQILAYIAFHEGHHLGIGSVCDHVRDHLRESYEAILNQPVKDVSRQLTDTIPEMSRDEADRQARHQKSQWEEIPYETIQEEMECDAVAVINNCTREWYEGTPPWVGTIEIALTKALIDQLLSSVSSRLTGQYHPRTWSQDRQHWHLRLRNSILADSLPFLLHHATGDPLSFVHSNWYIRDNLYRTEPVREFLMRHLDRATGPLDFEQMTDSEEAPKREREYLERYDVVELMMMHYRPELGSPSWDTRSGSAIDFSVFSSSQPSE